MSLPVAIVLPRSDKARLDTVFRRDRYNKEKGVS